MDVVALTLKEIASESEQDKKPGAGHYLAMLLHTLHLFVAQNWVNFCTQERCNILRLLVSNTTAFRQLHSSMAVHQSFVADCTLTSPFFVCIDLFQDINDNPQSSRRIFITLQFQRMLPMEVNTN